MTLDPARHEPDPPWLPLLRRFLQALDAVVNHADLAYSIWLIFLADAWFRSEVARIAAIVVPRDWERHVVDDVAQEALLLLMRDLRRRFDLGVDRQQVEESFPAWIGSIINKACREAFRQKRGRQEQEPWSDREPWVDQRRSMDECQRISALIEQLEDPVRTVLQLAVLDYTPQETSEMLGIPKSRVYVYLTRGREQLRRMLDKEL